MLVTSCLPISGSICFVDKGGVSQASSIHVRFLYDEQVFRFIYRVDGQPIWNTKLDERAIIHVRKTRVERAEQLLRQIERENESLQAQVEKAQKEARKYKTEQLILYLKKEKGYLPNYNEI